MFTSEKVFCRGTLAALSNCKQSAADHLIDTNSRAEQSSAELTSNGGPTERFCVREVCRNG